MFNTTEEAISSPLPSQEGSLGAYSPTGQQESLQGFLPLPGHMAHHMPDFNSLYDSPAGGASEILVLEGRDGSHVNLTQSRFSRFASETTGSLNPFELTSRAFRNSSAEQMLQLPGYGSSSAQQLQAAASKLDEHSKASINSDLVSTAYRQSSSAAADRTAQRTLRQSDGIEADGRTQTAYRQSSSIAADGTAQTAAALEAITIRPKPSRPQASYGSYESLQISSQASARLPTLSRGEVSSYSQGQPQQQSNFSLSGYRGGDAVHSHTEVAGSTNHTPESAPVGVQRQQYPASPSSNYGGNVPDSPGWQGSWAGIGDSVAGSVHSPGQDSLHSYVESTPLRPAAAFEAGTPEHRKLASNVARLASAAALARSPGLAAAGTTAMAAQLSNPEIRTPRTFFNPSFDNHHEGASP